MVMIMSGWEIYNASPLFPFVFPAQRSRSAAGSRGALLWHFAAMWLLVVNGLVYLLLGLATGRFRRKLLPIRPASGERRQGGARGRLAHDDLAVYNAVQSCSTSA